MGITKSWVYWYVKLEIVGEIEVEHQGGNSQNFLSKFVRFFVTLRCFYRVVINRK